MKREFIANNNIEKLFKIFNYNLKIKINGCCLHANGWE